MNDKDTGLVSGLESECSDHEQLGQSPESGEEGRGGVCGLQVPEPYKSLVGCMNVPTTAWGCADYSMCPGAQLEWMGTLKL